MGFKSLSTQSKILKSPKSRGPLVLNVKTEYQSICPNPIEMDIEVVLGNINHHYYEWKSIEGNTGKFSPNSATLKIVFTPYGQKVFTKLQLTINKDTEEEQIYIIELYEKATAKSEAKIVSDGSIFPFYNEVNKAVKEIDLNFQTENLPIFGVEETIFTAGSSGRIIYPVGYEPDRVELFEYPSMTLFSTVYFPNILISGINKNKKYLAKTWYKIDNLPDLYAWSLITFLNVPVSENLKIVVLENKMDLTIVDSGSFTYRYLGNGARIILNEDNVELLINNSDSNLNNLGFLWRDDLLEEPEPMSSIKSLRENLANNTPRLQIKASGSGITTFLNYKTGTFG
jgi:hypothetical protein